MSPEGIDNRAPCIIGVGHRTWKPTTGEDAPEPLEMWTYVARLAARDAGKADLLERLGGVSVVYSQSWQYDDPAGRLAENLKIPGGATKTYSGIGGVVPQLAIQDALTKVMRGERRPLLIVGGEALATKKRAKKEGRKLAWSFPPTERSPFPWEAPFHPAEVAHEVFQAWMTFALFDNARRAHLGIALNDYRQQLGELMAPLSDVAARNPDSWFPTRRSAQEIATPTTDNRMVSYPYTKYMVSVMDVDQAAAVLVTNHASADEMGVPQERRVYLRGSAYLTDPVYVAEHDDLWRSPAMEAAANEAMRRASVDIKDIKHFDLYSCFPSSLNFARDALKLPPGDVRPITLTGGLPYHGGPGSNYMMHSIAAMTKKLRQDPGSLGMVSGVGMHMTKHAYSIFSTEPQRILASEESNIQANLDAARHTAIRDTYAGPATIASYSVVHGPDGAPAWGIAICDLPEGDRCYAKILEPVLLAQAEAVEIIGQEVRVATGDRNVNTITW